MTFLNNIRKIARVKFFNSLLIIATIGVLIYSPYIAYHAGNVFFGDVSALYNLRVAQRLFLHATEPVFLTLPPQYAHHQLSRTYFIQGDLERALDKAEKELFIYPSSIDSHYIIGLTLGYMNREREAIDAFTKFIETHPATWAARNDKAWLQFRIGEIDAAIETLKPLVETHRENVWVQNTYCALMISKKLYHEAKKSCEYAQAYVEVTSEEMWGMAYPGNDPRIYGVGLEAMKKSIQKNLELIALSQVKS